MAEHYDNIEDYLRHGSDDRSESDFHVCCRFIEHGVDESEAYRLLANNSNSNTDTADASQSYWQRTWQKAKQAVGAKENTKTLSQEASSGDAESYQRSRTDCTSLPFFITPSTLYETHVSPVTQSMVVGPSALLA